MGLGKQVADAYIDVHGDLSKFRKDLDKANGGMAGWAEQLAEDFSETWGKRMRSRMDGQWDSIITMMESGRKVDFDRMINNFDPTDTVRSFSQINALLDEANKKSKITSEQVREIQFRIGKQLEISKQLATHEGRLAKDREMWERAHKKMMDELAHARRDQSEAEKKMLREAYAENSRFHAARNKMLTEAHSMNERYNSARRKMFSEAIRDNEAWAKSFSGVLNAAKKMDLDKRFRDLGQAMATNDWSAMARGTKNMAELRQRTIETAEEMRKLGRMTEEQFLAVQQSLDSASRNLDTYNIKFAEANKASDRQRKDWGLISVAIGNAGKKFAGFSGLNVVSDIFRDGAQFFQDLDRNAVKIGKMALLVGTLGSAVVSMLGGVAVIGQDLAKLGQISILAPGFLTAAGIQVGVLVAALKDMKDVLGDLGPAFGALQDKISAEFWGQAEAPIRNLVDVMLPTLTTKLGETAGMLGGMTAAFANSLASISTEDISTMFDRMNSSIGIATGAVDPLVQAFNTLGMVGSQYFERFATWIVEISTKFNDFIQAAAADGRLNTWIEEAIQAFKDVWSILGSAVGIFNAIGDAAEAAGIGGLSVLASNLRSVSDVMNGPAFQETLTQLFSGAAEATRAVGTALAELGPAIQSFMPTLSGVLVTIGETAATVIGYIGQIMSNPALQEGLTAFVEGVQGGIEALAPAIGPLGDSLGQIGGLLGQVATQVGEIVSAMVTNLSPILDTVTEAFGRITFAAGPEIVSIIETISTVLGGFVDALLPPLENIIMTVLPLIAPAFEALVPVFEAIQGVLAPFVEGIGQLVEMIAPYLVPAIQQISEALTPVIEVIGVVVEAIMSVLVPVLGFLLIGVINNVVGVFQGFSNIVQGIVTIVTGVFEGFATMFQKLFEGDIGGALEALGGVFKSIWDGIWQVVKGVLELLWNGVQLLFIGKLIGGVKTALTGIGAFFKSIWSGIGGTVSGALNNILRFVTGGLGSAKNFVSSALSAMLNFFRSGWSNMMSATSNGISNVLSWIGRIPGQIMNYLGNLGSLLWGAGSAIINGLLNGLKAAWGAVTSFVGGIASWIRDNKGPLPYDRQLLIPAGQAIMDGLGKGLEDKLGMLKNVLGHVTDTMTDSVTEAFAKNKMYLAGADAALGLADGLKSNKRAVATALSAVMPEASSSISATLVRTATSPEGGRSTDPQPARGTVIEAGAIVVQTPTKNPEIVAAKVIDEFANYSNL